MDALLAFAAALVALRLAGRLAARHRERPARELAAWSASLLAFALASGALAAGAAAGWNGPVFRAYYLFGALVTVPLLGAGSLLRAGHRWAAPAAVAWTGMSLGLVLAVPLEAPVAGTAIPEAQAHLELVPVRLAALVGNSLGTLAVVGVALATLRRRPLGNALIVAGVVVAAAGSALFGLGIAGNAASLAAAALLLYAGFVAGPGRRVGIAPVAARAEPDPQPEAADRDDRAELECEPAGAAVAEDRA